MKSRFDPIFFLIVMIALSLPSVLSAQLGTGGLPCSFSQSIPPDTNNFISFEPPSMDVLSMEDIQSPLPYRFAVNLPADIGIGSAGQWTKSTSGTKVWRLNLKSPGAHALILYFDRYKIPEGGKIFVYNPTRTQLLGAFTALNNNNLSTFATGLIYGDELTLEYNAPDGLQLPELHISEVGHAYRGISGYTGENRGFGGSGPCEVNVNCLEGNNWQKQKRSVTRIAIKRGSLSVWCTGSLVNNVRNDGKPYILTADHCGYKSSATDISQWIFYFNYESSGCPKPTTEPPLKSLTGATLIAHGGNAAASGSDFFMVLLTSPIPYDYNVYFNGWSRETNPPSPSGTTIHHPQGDIKKISTYTNALKPSVWTNGSKLAHWKVSWAQTENGHGTTENGSSGSPLYDNQGRLVGTLTGGDSKCDSGYLNLPDWYGMFSYSWDQNGTDSSEVLKYWLDPDNKDVMALNGWALSTQGPEQNDWVKIFPNPVMDQLTIKSSDYGGKYLYLSISDIWGNLRFKSDWDVKLDQEKQVDMSGFASGLYILKIADGDRQVVRKIVKQ